MVICEALAQLVMKQVVRRREQLGQMSVAGEVIHEFSDYIVGAKMRAGTVAVGDEMVVVRKHACYKARIQSIQVKDKPYERLDVVDSQEIGLRLTVAVNEGAQLMKLPVSLPSIPEERSQELSPPDVSQLIEPEDSLTDTDSL